MLSPDSIISGRLALAYSLNSKELAELVDIVGAKFRSPEFDGHKKISVPDGEEYSHAVAFSCAKEHVQYIIDKRGLDHFSHHMFWKFIPTDYGLGEDTVHDYEKKGMLSYLMAATPAPLPDYGQPVVSKGDDVSIDLIASVMEHIILESSVINKKKSVIYLYNCGYSLIKNVRGISKEYIKFVIEKYEEIGSTYKKSDEQVFIEAWEKTVNILKEKSKIIAAKLAIQKLMGKTSIEAYDAVINGDATPESKKQIVSRYGKIATELASEYGLKLPEWSTPPSVSTL